MLQRMFRDIGSYNRMTNVAIDQFRFSANYTYTAENLEELPSIFVPKGYWYGVFRRIALDTAPEFHTFDFTKKSILLVRDPRDILTSYYYSIAYSHLAPGDSGKTLRELGKEATPLSIDQYVVNLAPEFLSRFRKYIELLLPNPLCEVFRYEDIIDHKLEFIQAAVKHFHLSFPEQMARTLATKEDIKPVKENVYEHIRRVTPGDHKEKLKAGDHRPPQRHFQRSLAAFPIRRPDGPLEHIPRPEGRPRRFASIRRAAAGGDRPRPPGAAMRLAARATPRLPSGPP